MENLEMEKFNPTVAELSQKANEYECLVIHSIDDVEWFEKVKEARKDLKEIRVKIEKFWKAMRDKATQFNRTVLEEQRKLTVVIEPVEQKLEEKEKRFKEETEKEKRKRILPDRKEELERHWIVADDDKILSMTSDEFNKFVLDERERMLKEKELKQEEEAKK